MIRFRSRRSALSRVAKWAGGIVLALLLIDVLAVAALAAFGGNWLRGPVERLVQEKTGRALKIGGDVRFGFGWPLLRVTAAQVAFANADWARQPPDMFAADEIDASLRLSQLLVGRVVVDELRLRHAAITLEKDAQGRKNWELPGGPGTVSIQRMALDDSRIDYEEPARKTSVHAQISTTPSGLAFAAKGHYAGKPVEAHGSGGPLLALRDESTPYPFSVEASVGPVHARAQGSVTGLQNVAALDAKVDASGDSLDRLFPLIGVALPETPPYRTSGRVVHDGKVWRYEKFAAHVGESDVAGTLVIDASGKRPIVSGDLVFGLLDVADLGATLGTRETHGRALPDSRFNPDRWNTIDADVRLSAQKIVRPHDVPLERFATHLRMRDAVLTLDPLEFGIAGGKLSGTIRLDGRSNPIRAAAKLRVDKVALDRLVPGFATGEVDVGRIDGTIDLTGTGNSVAQMLGDADGTAAVLIDGGHVSRLLMEEIGLHLPRIVLLKLGGDRRIPIRCAAADFKVADGVMHTQTGVFDTTVTRVDAAGDVNLRDETMDLTLSPNTKETAFFSLRTPIHIRGTLTKPDVQLEKGPIAAKAAGAAALAIANPLLGLIPLLEAGPGQDSDCGRLLTASPAAANAKKAPLRRTPAK
jgi:AsmA protein